MKEKVYPINKKIYGLFIKKMQNITYIMKD